MDWPTVLSLAGLFAIGFGYLARQMNRLNDNLSKRMDRLESNLSKRVDQLTDRYISHLENHPR
jgi:hypothetical protein